MVTMAKGMASSYEPLSAVAVKQEIFDLFLNDPADPDQRMNFFRDISTYGGCTGPLVAALETMRIIEDEKLIENSKEMGSYLLGRLQELKDLPLVGDVRGMGLFCGVEFVRDKTTREPVSEAEMAKIVASMLAQNIIVGRTNTSITGLNVTMNFAPALIITKDEVDRVVGALRYTVEAGI
jgi:taurine-pyruvate aminotransferase